MFICVYAFSLPQTCVVKPFSPEDVLELIPNEECVNSDPESNAYPESDGLVSTDDSDWDPNKSQSNSDTDFDLASVISEVSV